MDASLTGKPCGELYLVRHGQTMFNEKRVIQGWCDAPLTELGRAQARRIGRYFEQAGIRFDAAYTSTLTRTQETISRITDMPYERIESLREWGFGAFEGERVSLMPPFPWGDFYVPFGGEGQLQVRERVCRALGDAMERACADAAPRTAAGTVPAHKDADAGASEASAAVTAACGPGFAADPVRVLAVSHGSACREFLTHWVPDGGFDGGRVPGNCSVMRFSYTAGAFALREVLEQEDLACILDEER